MAACLGRTYYLIVSKRQSRRRLRASWSNPETGLGSFGPLVSSGSFRAPRRTSFRTKAFPWRFSRLFKLFSGAEEASSIEILIGQSDDSVQRHPFTLNPLKMTQSRFCHVVCLFFFPLLAQRNGTQLIPWFRQTKAPYHKFKSVMRPAVKNLEFK